MRVRPPHHMVEPSLRRASLIDLKRYLRSTGADTRLSSNHGSNERSPLRRNFQPRRWRMAVLAMCSLQHKMRQKRGRGGTQPTDHAVAAPLVHGWLEKRSRRRAGGSSLEFRRSPAGPRGPVRGWRPDAAAAHVAAARQSWRPAAAAELAVQHTHQQSRHGHRSLTRPPNAGPRGLPQVHLERREARQAPGADPTVLEGHRQIPADDAEARLRWGI